MGRVYRARGRELDEVVALKLLHPQHETPNALAGLRPEVPFARRVTHRTPRAPPISASTGAVRFVTMELVQGEPLSSFLDGGQRIPLPHVRGSRSKWRGSRRRARGGVVHRT